MYAFRVSHFNSELRWLRRHCPPSSTNPTLLNALSFIVHLPASPLSEMFSLLTNPQVHRHALSISSPVLEASLFPTNRRNPLSATSSLEEPLLPLPNFNPSELLQPPQIIVDFFFIPFALWVFAIYFNFNELNEKMTFYFSLHLWVLLFMTCGKMLREYSWERLCRKPTDQNSIIFFSQ